MQKARKLLFSVFFSVQLRVRIGIHSVPSSSVYAPTAHQKSWETVIQLTDRRLYLEHRLEYLHH